MGSGSVTTCVLLSGGLDSAACLHYYLALERPVRALFVDYDQAAVHAERGSARAVARFYGAALGEITVSGPKTFSAGEIVGRNAFLVMTAAMHHPTRSGVIALGIHAGTGYYDCSPDFLSLVNRILDGYSDGRVRCDAPFIGWDKLAIWRYCQKCAVPVELTYSCEAGQTPPCGRCLSCLDRRQLHASKA
jgi:7-cyano-7-deazaguanine synthase